MAKTSASSEYENPSFSLKDSSHEYQGLFQLPGNANETNNYEELHDPPVVSSQEYQGLYHLPDDINVNEANNYEELRDKHNGDYMNIKEKVK